MKKILNIGIAGFGVVGQRRKYFIDKHPNLRTIAVCDIRFQNDGALAESSDFFYSKFEKNNVKKFYEGTLDKDCVYFSDYKTLLNNKELDAIFVCLPNYLASTVTIEALEKGLSVFCEKPPGRNVNEIKKVMEIEEQHPNLKLKYGFNHRYHESVKEAKRIIDSKEYGKIINLRGVYGKSEVIPFSGGWRSKKEYSGGGILLDQGIHMLDMIRYYAGEFIEYKSYISNDYWGHNVEDNAYALMKSENGCIAMIHSTATQWQHKFRLEITLKEALLELTGILSGSKSYGEEKLKVVNRKKKSSIGSQSESTFHFLNDNSWENEIDEFANIIINDEKVINGNSDDALRVMEMVYNIYYADNNWDN